MPLSTTTAAPSATRIRLLEFVDSLDELLVVGVVCVWVVSWLPWVSSLSAPPPSKPAASTAGTDAASSAIASTSDSAQVRVRRAIILPACELTRRRAYLLGARPQPGARV